MNTDEERLNDISGRVIGAAMTVSNTLGAGFLEKVYENALVHELRRSGLRVEQQRPLAVTYDGVIVGEYAADVIVEGSVILELKAVRVVDQVHVAQCLNYLKATGMRLCLLLNFGSPRLQVKRIIRD
ncbi:MAG: GxxExxY protein [candidate division NC10 bacterium RIFCSPLOWO2_12_FULL_66_18]|nr:MAG: GxxExxY protein [candidate division NC10 bacterium RIFCSPLOWO2_12_FULL_66_18]